MSDGWAKIEIEFPCSQHDPNEVVQFLTEHFRHESGVPTAEITLVDPGASESESTPVAVYPWATGRPPSSVKAGADAIARAFPGKKIQAIKEFRAAYGYQLKEAKDQMDEAYGRVAAENLASPPPPWAR